MTPSVPNEPVSRRERSKPATFFITWPPKLQHPRPCASSTLTPSTKSRTEPAAARRGPEKPAATQPAERRLGTEVGRLAGQHLPAAPPAPPRSPTAVCPRARSSPARSARSPRRRCSSGRPAARPPARSRRSPWCRCRGCAAASRVAAAALRMRSLSRRLMSSPLKRCSESLVRRPPEQALRLARAAVERSRNRGSSGNFSCPRCTCIEPNSAQRCSVGTALPGFSRPCWSNAA